MSSKSIYARFASSFLALGYSPIARFPDNKWPKAWSDYCDAPADAEHHRKWGMVEGTMLALACGYRNLVAIDVDTNEVAALDAVMGALPQCRVARVGSKGWALLARYKGEAKCSFKTITTGEGKEKAALVEVKGIGANITIPPSIHHKTKNPYRWIDPKTGVELAARPAFDELPIIEDGDLAKLYQAMKPWASQPRPQKPKERDKSSSKDGRKNYERYFTKTYDNVVAEVAEATSGRPTILFRNACRVGVAVHHNLMSEHAFVHGFIEASRRNGLLAREGLRAIEATLDSALGRSASDELPELPQREKKPGSTRHPGPNGKGYTNGHDEQATNGHDKTPPPPGTPPPPLEGVAESEFNSESEVANKFCGRTYENLRFVKKWNDWVRFNGKVWVKDETEESRDQMHQLCREISFGLDGGRSAKIESDKMVRSATALAASDRRIAATTDQWDADPLILNTPAGVIDLRTGEIRPARPEDYMLMITNVAPDADCPHPEWDGFLKTISGDDEEWIAYIQRMSGYFLTGMTDEHALFFAYGTGANGKGTIFKVLSEILGVYHKTSPVEMFLVSKFEKHSEELARLQGARLVTASETHQGRSWDEAKIKTLSGGDKITARFMRQNSFEFYPSFKLFISGNHRPSIKSVDEAIKRRLHLIPFTTTISDSDRQIDFFVKKLVPELPGIFAWMVQGAIERCRDGTLLNPPKRIRSATDEYLGEEDTLGTWFEERAEKRPRNFVSGTALFESWKSWAEKSGEFVGSKKKFIQELKNKQLDWSIEHKKTKDSNGFVGIALKDNVEYEPQQKFWDGSDDTPF